MSDIKILAFDTGGTILDWHSGIFAALTECGQRRGVAHDWARLTNEYRRRALRRMVGQVDPGFNIDDVHRDLLDELVADRVHLLVDGVIVAEGGPELVASIESEGYDAWRR